ncbi:hypothetical protein SAMN02745164_02218 [Marinitoga hydrogenitolerans DSM 16785]|uniref:Uncharacterized protein n=1 Tax=Marinitoga hydrogenitolerans (strain DSM 16785 / JCM 12826 / AT1271) TaxID=1122195 RepID=A0A1M5AL14_MARH1|nr:hypothetical protein [Marinitoga hydrogenitolerans]SHF30951.1 hypothetical protein SAMN02745164_02218 [Marinitoga hydrogenitolerans DSM 16785]
MALLKGIDGSYFELNPRVIKKFWFADSIDEDVEEKYIFEVKAKTGDFIWMPNEFSVELADSIDVEMEYIPTLLTIFRLNRYFNNRMKSIFSFLSTDSLMLTESIINQELMVYTINESVDFSAVYVNKSGRYYEHHFIFSRYDYQSVFDISIKTTMTEIKKFYKSLINEFNKFRLNVLPEIINQEDFLKHISQRIKIVNYNELKNIEDNIFQLYNINNLNKSMSLSNSSEAFKAFTNFIAEMKKQNSVKDEDEDIDIEIFMEEDENSDENETLWEIIDEIEEEIKNMLEGEEIENDFILTRDEKLESIYVEIQKSYEVFNRKVLDEDDEKKEEKLLKSLILIYGVETIYELKEKMKKDFKVINLEKLIDEYLKNSDEGIVMEYKKWYKKIIKKLGKNLNQIT